MLGVLRSHPRPPGHCRRLLRGTAGAWARPATVRRGLHSLLDVQPAVRQALHEGTAVVALETTIVSHGMPWPRNVECQRAIEAAVAAEGAVPAAVAVMGGRLRVGLDEVALELLANPASPSGKHKRVVTKCSRRDLAAVVASGGLGATTVAGTMIVADMAGIPVFATGGIGGVHRGAESTWDVSADLTELGRTPVAVVCAGVKSILDIPKTLEYLETQGVAVMAYGADHFPAFFTASSGLKAPLRVDTPEVAARILSSSMDLGLRSGSVIAVPNPSPADGDAVEAATQQALKEAAEQGHTGAAATPFLLSRVAQLTAGASLESNIALVTHNARVAARIAVQLARLRREKKPSSSSGGPVASTAFTSASTSSPKSSASASSTSGIAKPSSYEGIDILVIGGAVVDKIARPLPGQELQLHTSNPGIVTQSYGGVGRNVAEVVARLGGRVALITALAPDSLGEELQVLQAYCREVGVDVRPVEVAGEAAADLRTPVYSALLDGKGDLVAAVADMAAFEALTFQAVLEKLQGFHGSHLLLDANLPAETIEAVARHAAYTRSDKASTAICTVFECVSTVKCLRVINALRYIDVLKGNALEIGALAVELRRWGVRDDISGTGRADHDDTKLVLQEMSKGLASRGVKRVIVTRGSGPVLHVSVESGRDSDGHLIYEYEDIPVPPVSDIVKVTGAGDTFLGAMLTMMARKDRGFQDTAATAGQSIRAGVAAAGVALRSPVGRSTISDRLQPSLLENLR